MNIVFLGASVFGLRCLKKVAELPGCSITGVVTAPRQFAISYRPAGVTNVLHADFQSYCSETNIPYVEIQKGMSDPLLLEQVRQWGPDIFLVVGWYHMVPALWRTLAPAYGLHASLLPDYSGGAPLVWALINGEQRTGITLFQLGDGVDNGPVVGQAATDIDHLDTIATLYYRIEELGESLLLNHLPKLANNTVKLTEQNEALRRTYPQRGPEDGRIDWNWDAERIRNFVRAQTSPYPGAFTFLGDQKVSIWSVALSYHNLALRPGQIVVSDNLVFVGSGADTCLQLVLVGEVNEKMDALAWWQRINLTKRHESFTN